MAKQETLQAEKRDVKGSTASKRLRRTGVVPAVIYGSKQREYMIQLNSKALGLESEGDALIDQIKTESQEAHSLMAPLP